MRNFHYQLAQTNTPGTQSSRPNYQAPMSDAEAQALIASLSGQSLANVAAVLAATFAVILDACGNTRRVLDLGGVMSFQPVCGGAVTDGGAGATAASLKCAVSGFLRPQPLTDYRQSLSITKDVDTTFKAPVITGVFVDGVDMTVGGMIGAHSSVVIIGSNLPKFPLAEGEGLKLVGGGGGDYTLQVVDSKPSRLSAACVASSDNKADAALRVSTKIGATLRNTSTDTVFDMTGS